MEPGHSYPKRHPMIDEELNTLSRLIDDKATNPSIRGALLIAKHTLEWFDDPVNLPAPSVALLHTKSL